MPTEDCRTVLRFSLGLLVQNIRKKNRGGPRGPYAATPPSAQWEVKTFLDSLPAYEEFVRCWFEIQNFSATFNDWQIRFPALLFDHPFVLRQKVVVPGIFTFQSLLSFFIFAANFWSRFCQALIVKSTGL